jgi:Ca2+-dependent lipid-binding protein
MDRSDPSKEVDASDAGSANSKPVKIHTLAGRKKKMPKGNVPAQKEDNTSNTSLTTSNKTKSVSIDIQTSQNTQGAVNGEAKKSSDATMEDSPLETEQVVEFSEEDRALLKKFEKLSEKYIFRARELVQRSTDGSLEEESFQKDARDGKVIIPEVVNSHPFTSTNEFKDDWLNCICLLIQGRLVSYRLLCMIYYCF